jgi:two-component system phosphate regulon sensor histidine kinase PhoR
LNDNASIKFKGIVGSSGFRIAWFLLAAVVVTIAIVWAGGLAPIFAAVATALLVIVAALATASIFIAVKKTQGASLGDNELKSILTSIDDVLVVYDQDFKIVFFNGAAEKMFKIAATAALGHVLSARDVENDSWRVLAQVIFPSLAPRVIIRSKEGDFPQVADVTLTDPELELRVTTVPVLDAAGNPLAFMKIVRDRTAFMAALRSKNEFVTVASHQLRGPVTDINWALQSLSGVSELGETNKMIVDTAAAASQNLLRRIEDLLNIAKMEDGQVGYQFEDTDIVDYIGKLLADILPAARKAGVKIYFDRPTEPMPHVQIDPKHLSLAVANLLENAIRYNVENGEVTVKIDKMADKPFVAVSIKDSGIGIPPDAINKLFTKFYRADNAVKSQTEGSGLGLYITKGIITAHGGQISAESELNRGTTISFTLPTDPSLLPKREVSTGDLI